EHRGTARVSKRTRSWRARQRSKRTPGHGHGARRGSVSDVRVSRPSLPDAGERVTLPGRGPGALPPLSMVAPPPAPAGVALAIGFAMGRERILRRPTALSALVGAALVVVSALVERRLGSAGAVDRALAGTFNVVVPLVTFGLAGEASARGNLREAAW